MFGLVPRDTTFDNVVDELVTDISIRDTVLSFEPRKLKKNNMVRLVRDKFSDKTETFEGLRRTISDIELYFSGLNC